LAIPAWNSEDDTIRQSIGKALTTEDSEETHEKELIDEIQ
jgi:hypothetical protein